MGELTYAILMGKSIPIRFEIASLLFVSVALFFDPRSLKYIYDMCGK